jgi:hypothetical protein
MLGGFRGICEDRRQQDREPQWGEGREIWEMEKDKEKGKKTASENAALFN